MNKEVTKNYDDNERKEPVRVPDDFVRELHSTGKQNGFDLQNDS